MRADLTRQLVTAATFIVTLAVNAAANVLPINGQRTAEISDRYEVFVVPAGYVFSIWGLIYTLLLAFTVWQALPRNRADETLRSIGYLPAIAGVLNAAWVVLFHYEAFVLTVPVMLALLVTLIAIHVRLWARRDALSGAALWLVRVPFSVYLGWITVATIANIAQTLSSLGFTAFGIEPALVAAVVLLVGLAIATRFVLEFRDAAYGLVIVWAYVGIVVKEQDTIVVATVAAASALIVGALVVLAVVRGRREASERPGAAQPA
jgi:hypothetical protein